MEEQEQNLTIAQEILNLPFELEWEDFDFIMDGFKQKIDEL